MLKLSDKVTIIRMIQGTITNIYVEAKLILSKIPIIIEFPIHIDI